MFFTVALDLAHHAVSVGADRVELLGAGGGERRDAFGDLFGALIQMIGQRADRMHRFEELAAFAVRPAGEVLQALGDLVDPFGIARQRLAELVEIDQRVVEGLLVLLDEFVDPVQRIARALRDVERRTRRRREQRRILLRPDQRRRRRIAALQRYRGDAGEALEFQADLGVLAHRHRLLDRNDGDHLLRPLGVELEIGDFADADAVEQHRGAGAQAGNRSVEHHAVVGALAGAADVLEPVDESEHAEHDAQREQPDHHVISSGFHHATPARTLNASRWPARDRLPWK